MRSPDASSRPSAWDLVKMNLFCDVSLAAISGAAFGGAAVAWSAGKPVLGSFLAAAGVVTGFVSDRKHTQARLKLQKIPILMTDGQGPWVPGTSWDLVKMNLFCDVSLAAISGAAFGGAAVAWSAGKPILAGFLTAAGIATGWISDREHTNARKELETIPVCPSCCSRYSAEALCT